MSVFHRLGPPDFHPQTPNCPEETLTKDYVQSGYRETVEGLEVCFWNQLKHLLLFLYLHVSSETDLFFLLFVKHLFLEPTPVKLDMVIVIANKVND